MAFGAGSIHHGLDRAVQDFDQQDQQYRTHEKRPLHAGTAPIQGDGDEHGRQKGFLTKCGFFPPGVPEALKRIAESTEDARPSSWFVSFQASSACLRIRIVCGPWGLNARIRNMSRFIYAS